MQYGTEICSPSDFSPSFVKDNVCIPCDNGFSYSCDPNYMKFVGYDANNGCARQLFDSSNIKLISKKVTEILQGVEPTGRPIVVDNNVICSVLGNLYTNRKPQVADIYSRFVIGDGDARNDVRELMDQCINVITTYIKNEYGMIENNHKLNIWDATILGDGNKLGLRQVPPIKIKQRRPQTMMFNMNY